MTKTKSHPHSIHFTDKSRTKQAMKQDCDINKIMKQHASTGLTTHLNSQSPLYGDFSNIPDYQSAMNTVILAQDMFINLPSDIRAKFHNDPNELIKFMDNPENHAEAIELGIKKKLDTPEYPSEPSTEPEDPPAPIIPNTPLPGAAEKSS